MKQNLRISKHEARLQWTYSSRGTVLEKVVRACEKEQENVHPAARKCESLNFIFTLR